MGTRLPALLLAGLAVTATPLDAQEPRAVGVATIRVPVLLSYRVMAGPADGGADTVVIVRANQDWRLTVRNGIREAVLEGGPGRDQRYVLDPALVAGRRDSLRITLTPR
jgi:hypothetical protein